MKLKIYALVVEIVGGLTVLVGLIFVGFARRQSLSSLDIEAGIYETSWYQWRNRIAT